jgi:hypothetical protein
MHGLKLDFNEVADWPTLQKHFWKETINKRKKILVGNFLRYFGRLKVNAAE